MLMQEAADRAAGSNAHDHFEPKLAAARLTVSLLLLGPLLTGCVVTGPPLPGADPADPHVPVARVGYRSSTAPYLSLRPVTPTGWKDQNSRVAPAPKNQR